MDPHIFADPDPGNQNLADPTDPDPKHWVQVYKLTDGSVTSSNIFTGLRSYANTHTDRVRFP